MKISLAFDRATTDAPASLFRTEELPDALAAALPQHLRTSVTLAMVVMPPDVVPTPLSVPPAVVVRPEPPKVGAPPEASLPVDVPTPPSEPNVRSVHQTIR